MQTGSVVAGDSFPKILKALKVDTGCRKYWNVRTPRSSPYSHVAQLVYLQSPRLSAEESESNVRLGSVHRDHAYAKRLFPEIFGSGCGCGPAAGPGKTCRPESGSAIPNG